MALYEISRGQSATQVAKRTKRNPQTLMEWVHKYNQGGVEALKYQHSGGHLTRVGFLQTEVVKMK